jgi:hypothetical protein
MFHLVNIALGCMVVGLMVAWFHLILIAPWG